MRFTSETTSNGVSERLFTLGDITGVLWSPASATGSRPLVLLSHGGGQHKRAPGLLARAQNYVTACGFAVAAIDAPGHGERPRTEHDERLTAIIRQRMATGEPIGPQIARANAERATLAVPEWHVTLDALQNLDCVGAGGPVGFWGVSLGSAIGVPFVAAEPRITAAVFGLVGHETLAEAARRVTVPVEFLLQCDDELVPRDSGLDCLTPSHPGKRACTPTPAATRAYPRSSWKIRRASSPVISSKAALQRTPGNLHCRTLGEPTNRLAQRTRQRGSRNVARHSA
jgi:pimeloyl-ACP methyl ester carboxylesterase